MTPRCGCGRGGASGWGRGDWLARSLGTKSYDELGIGMVVVADDVDRWLDALSTSESYVWRPSLDLDGGSFMPSSLQLGDFNCLGLAFRQAWKTYRGRAHRPGLWLGTFVGGPAHRATE